MPLILEADFPVSFRKKETTALEELIKKRHSAVLIGMKRVGISNFVRFFIARKRQPGQIFIYVDLNDLIEISLPAFWTLVLTRLVDGVQKSKLPETAKRRCRRLFIQSIQLKDDFFTLESVRKILGELTGADLLPVLFILRFDRLQTVISHNLLSNLIGLYDSTHHHLAYVLTSFLPLERLAPKVFSPNHLITFARDLYLPAATKADSLILLNSFAQRYHARLDNRTKQALIDWCGGHAQYLQLAVIILSQVKKIPEGKTALFKLLSGDEQIRLQSAELKSSLRENDYPQIPLFIDYLQSGREPDVKSEFTQKEARLFKLLKARRHKICDRDMIIDAVWPETKETGITDWAIERLVSRVRSKLALKKSRFKILTVHTRGYKLV